ncbi:MAG: PAS domain-containing protein [Alphaproteobacteria bacterium]
MLLKNIAAETRVEAYLPELAAAPPSDEFFLLANHLPTLCWIARADGYIVWYNDRWHAYCGTTPDAMAGWGWQQVHDPNHLPTVLETWQKAIAEEKPFEMVFPLKGADGVFRPFLTRITPLRDATGKVARWYGVNTDISEQAETEKALAISRNEYQTLTDVMPQMVWSTLPDGFHDYYNAQWYEFTGVPAGSTDGEAWNGMFHPDDQDRAWARWRHSLSTGENYEIEYRLRHRSGQYRWTLGRAQPVRDGAGKIVRWIGTCTDIHDAKIASEQNELLNRELSHRIKNIFSIIGGLVALSARFEPGAKEFARSLAQRITALGRAHEFARPHSEQSRPQNRQTTLQGLCAALFLPYELDGRPRVILQGDDVEVDDKGATPLSLLFHELATNAAKYGALSVEGGTVLLTIRRQDGTVEMTWDERGGPAVTGVPAHQGFGTRLAALSVEQQLGGRLQRDWRPQGLLATIRIQTAH